MAQTYWYELRKAWWMFGVPAIIAAFAWGLFGRSGNESISYLDFFVVVWVSYVLGVIWKGLWWK